MAVYKHQLERKLKEQQQWFATTLRSIGDAIITTDTNQRVTFMNLSAEQLTGWSEAQAVGRSLPEICPIVYEESGEAIDEITEAMFHQPMSFTEDKPVLLITKDQRTVSVLVNFAPIQDETSWLGLVLVLQDNTERRAAEQKLAKAAEAQENLIEELQEAMARIKTLHGLIPICASCKKIRDDGGYWHQVETYLSHHSDAQFSHGLCPDCFETLYPDYLTDKP
jgi:PAS domain S-box-containing protein